MPDELRTPPDLLNVERSYTLSQTEKLLSIIAVFLLVCVITVGLLVFALRSNVADAHRAVNRAAQAVQISQENGYKNRAIVCSIYHNMVKSPDPLIVCSDPHILKYETTTKR